MIMRILHFASSDGKFGSAACLKELVFLEKKNNLEPIVIHRSITKLMIFVI